MKKSGFFFLLSSLLWGIAAIAALCIFPKLWFVWVPAGAAVWGVWAACFHAIAYELKNGILKISSGFLFKRERILPEKEILMTTRVALAGKLLFTVATFSGGRVILFAEYSI